MIVSIQCFIGLEESNYEYLVINSRCQLQKKLPDRNGCALIHYICRKPSQMGLSIRKVIPFSFTKEINIL